LIAYAAGWKPNGDGKKGALTRAAREVGVPWQTLGRWCRAESNPPPHDIVQYKKEDMLSSLVNLLGLHIDEAHDSIKDADHHQVMGGIKITFEAIQLLTGGPTENVNKRILNVDWDD
jgi:hypothetical protein